jgi:mannitol 2-dehydrogenase
LADDEQEAHATTVRVSGTMIEFIKPFDAEAMLGALARPEIRIVSLTVTEGLDLEASRRKVAERFANPKIGDTICRLCLDGSNRQPTFILPTVRDRLARRASVNGLALVSAMWYRYCYGDRRAARHPAERSELGAPAGCAETGARRPARVPARCDIFGEPADIATYVAAFSGALASLWLNSVRATDYFSGNA